MAPLSYASLLWRWWRMKSADMCRADLKQVSNFNKAATIIQSDTQSKKQKKKEGVMGVGRAVQVQYVLIIQMCSASGDARHWVEQGHAFGSSERQALGAVMVHHLGDAGKHAAALVQGVGVFLRLSHDDVNAALARPNSQRREGGREEKRSNHTVRSDFLSGYL